LSELDPTSSRPFTKDQLCEHAPSSDTRHQSSHAVTYCPAPNVPIFQARIVSTLGIARFADMSSSLSPDQFGSAHSPSSPEGTSTSQDRSPLNLGFLKSLTEKKTTRGESVGDGSTCSRVPGFPLTRKCKMAILPKGVAQSPTASLPSPVGKS
jgi:hypothetical protein